MTIRHHPTAPEAVALPDAEVERIARSLVTDTLAHGHDPHGLIQGLAALANRPYEDVEQIVAAVVEEVGPSVPGPRT